MHDAVYRRVLTSKTIMGRLFYETRVHLIFFFAVQLFAGPIGNGTSRRARGAACKRQFSSVSHFSSFGGKPHLDRSTETSLVSLMILHHNS